MSPLLPLLLRVVARTLNTSLSTSSASAGVLACAIAGVSCSTAGVSALMVPLDGSTQTFASADAPLGFTSYGMGSYNFTDGVVVDFPANAYSGNYSTTVTLAIAPPPVAG